MQQQGVGPLQVHGIPGTPVGDLFPPGNAVFGDGNRSSIRPIRAGELRSHSAKSSLPFLPNNRFSLVRISAKASFSAYVLGKNWLKIGESVHFSKKSTTNFGRPFRSFPFPFFATKWLKYAVFAF